MLRASAIPAATKWPRFRRRRVIPAPGSNGLLAIGEEFAGKSLAGNKFNSLKSLNDPERTDLGFVFCVKRGFSMKKLLIAAAVAVLATNAMAADFPRRAPGPIYADPVAARIFDWSGFYLGGNVGYGWGNMAGISTGGFLGGVHGGYNYMWPSGFLIGAEADLSAYQRHRLRRPDECQPRLFRHDPRAHRLRRRSHAVLRHRGLGLGPRHARQCRPQRQQGAWRLDLRHRRRGRISRRT